jgi:hypothetical protein
MAARRWRRLSLGRMRLAPDIPVSFRPLRNPRKRCGYASGDVGSSSDANGSRHRVCNCVQMFSQIDWKRPAPLAPRSGEKRTFKNRRRRTVQAIAAPRRRKSRFVWLPPLLPTSEGPTVVELPRLFDLSPTVPRRRLRGLLAPQIRHSIVNYLTVRK